MRRLLGLLGLVGVVVGTPVLLAVVGGDPFSVHHLHGALGRSVSDHDVLRIIAGACWLVWLLLTVAVIIEVAAVVAGRESPGATGSGLRIPGLQGLAGLLVLSVVLSGPHRAPAPSRVPAPTRPAPSVTALARPGDVTAAPVPAATATVPAAAVPYTVVPYDSPWAIAERYLGNGLRWREILDDRGSTLVDGQELVATAGGPVEEATARTIYPGQILLLPADAAGVPGEAPPPPPPAPPAPPPPEPSTPPIAASPASPPPTIWTGSLSDAVEARQPSPAIELAVARPVAATSTEQRDAPPVGTLAVGVGLLASAALNVVTWRRNRQQGQARRHERLAAPDPPALAAESRLRIHARDGAVTTVHRAVEALGIALERASGARPTIEAVLASAEAVEVVLSQPTSPPPMWTASPDRRRWRITTLDLPVVDGHPHSELLPTLVPVGVDTRTGAEVLLNLQPAGVTAVAGDGRASALVRGAALALTGLPWAVAADVVLVGFGEALAASRPHVRSIRRLDEVTDELRRLAATGPGERSTPTIVLAATPPSGDEVRVLNEVCRPGTGVTALVAGATPSSRILDAGAASFALPELDLEVRPAVPDADLLDGVSALLQPTPMVTRPAPEPPEIPHPPQPPVLVRVLGPLEVEGAGDFRRPLAREIVVYLATHRVGAAEHQLDEAVWPERAAVKPSTRDPVVSAARSAVGGPARLPHAHGQGPDKRYRVSDQVGTDWEQFDRLHASGRRSARIGDLLAALELVRGRPFADVVAGPGYAWLHLEGHVHHLEAEIADTADLAAELLLADGDARQARWAANRGLLASPYTERLWVRLMAVADALGEAREVERILAEMDRRLDLDGDYEQLHPDTLAAYRRYSRRTR